VNTRALVLVSVYLGGCYASPTSPQAPAAPPAPVEPQAPASAFARPSEQPCTDDDNRFVCLDAALAVFRDRACECAPGDKPCGDAVKVDAEAWMARVESRPQARPEPTHEETEAHLQVASSFHHCLMRATYPTPVPLP
jgi:hypothetical protein